MTHRITFTCAAFAMAVTTGAAVAQQGMPTVAPEMTHFEQMLGDWEGSGVVRMAPDAPAMPWTSTSTTEKVLDGHFVVDSMRIDIEGLPVPMMFHSINGWDAVAERFVTFGIGNNGDAKETTMHFVGNKAITTGIMVEDGHVVSDHWVTEYHGDHMHFSGRRSVDGGPFFVHVEGSAKRGGDGFKIGPETAAQAMAPPSESMKALMPMVGTWDVKGEWKPAADAGGMAITGKDVVEVVAGGHALRTTTKGQGGPMIYEAIGFLTWCPAKNSLVMVVANNMGQYHMSQCWASGEAVVMVASGAMDGKPSAVRSTLTMDGDEMTWRNFAAQGTDAPYEAFTSTMTRMEE